MGKICGRAIQITITKLIAATIAEIIRRRFVVKTETAALFCFGFT